MKNVLYISNIEVPYRNEFFNLLSKKVNLTVLYERKVSSNRDKKWASSVKSEYKKEYLKGIKIKKESVFSLSILKYIFSKKYDKIIIGCYNSPSQILAILTMKLFRKKYILNFDGECFFEGKNLKSKLKRVLAKGADLYLIAGEKSANNLAKFVPSDKIYPYYFSSLSKKEIINNAKSVNKNLNNTILVVGQFFEYKGLDIALEVARLNQNYKYKFVGSGNRSNLLKKMVDEMNLKNVEIIPFLQKKELYKEYQQCKFLLLTSRKECWGLVINEAASFGTPIIATSGVGAANEFLEYNKYSYVSKSCNPKDIYNILEKNYNKNLDEYRKFLLEKSKKYNIEKSVEITVRVLNI